ncbi:MAG: hypothetical protein FD173_695 [Gallionellaceae bacterium]|nr:MAG: hypothetical protein FD173_695 [Gallionellaceae bacterium]
MGLFALRGERMDVAVSKVTEKFATDFHGCTQMHTDTYRYIQMRGGLVKMLLKWPDSSCFYLCTQGHKNLFEVSPCSSVANRC